jgi:hypothetical protein
MLGIGVKKKPLLPSFIAVKRGVKVFYRRLKGLIFSVRDLADVLLEKLYYITLQKNPFASACPETFESFLSEAVYLLGGKS